jgi:hypothetical protein
MDENHGKGGSYEMRDGVRVLLRRAQPATPDTDSAAAEDGAAL